MEQGFGLEPQRTSGGEVERIACQPLVSPNQRARGKAAADGPAMAKIALDRLAWLARKPGRGLVECFGPVPERPLRDLVELPTRHIAVERPSLRSETDQREETQRARDPQMIVIEGVLPDRRLLQEPRELLVRLSGHRVELRIAPELLQIALSHHQRLRLRLACFRQREQPLHVHMVPLHLPEIEIQHLRERAALSVRPLIAIEIEQLARATVYVGSHVSSSARRPPLTVSIGDR